ncbi:hypothetical protein ISCGN_011937 [Ixodes scapularis]
MHETNFLNFTYVHGHLSYTFRALKMNLKFRSTSSLPKFCVLRREAESTFRSAPKFRRPAIIVMIIIRGYFFVLFDFIASATKRPAATVPTGGCNGLRSPAIALPLSLYTKRQKKKKKKKKKESSQRGASGSQRPWASSQ